MGATVSFAHKCLLDSHVLQGFWANSSTTGSFTLAATAFACLFGGVAAVDAFTGGPARRIAQHVGVNWIGA